MKFFTNLIGAIIGVFIGAFMIIFVGIVFIQLGVFNFSEGETTITTTKNMASSVYNSSVDSVITVVNEQEITVNNAWLQQYINSITNGELVESGIGSGFVYKKADGFYYALTNYHVIEGSDNVGIITTQSAQDGINEESTIDADVIGYDDTYDIAVIKFKSDQDIQPLEFANSDNIEVGQNVYAIGSPYGKEFYGSITSGIISAPIRTMSDETESDLKYIQTDASINPGNSGGPLLNEDGKVIGMNSMKIAGAEADNMGFAIPSNVIIEIANNIEDNATTSTDDDATFNFEDELNKLQNN